MDKQALELQSDRIERVLSQHGIHNRITGGIVTPRKVLFNLAATIDAEMLKLADELAMALGSSVAAMEGKTITIERNDASVVSLLALLGKLAKRDNSPSIPPFTAMLGMCDDGAPLLIRLPAQNVGHVLVSGAGASDLLRTIVVGLAVCNRHYAMRLVLVGQVFDDLARLPHAQYYQISDIMRLVGRSVVSPRVVIVANDLTSIDASLAQILRDGHASGIHVVASGNVSSAGFSTVIKSAGERGDFTAISDGQEIRFTAAYISPAEVNQFMLGVLPQRNPTRLQQAAALA